MAGAAGTSLEVLQSQVLVPTPVIAYPGANAPYNAAVVTYNSAGPAAYNNAVVPYNNTVVAAYNNVAPSTYNSTLASSYKTSVASSYNSAGATAYTSVAVASYSSVNAPPYSAPPTATYPNSVVSGYNNTMVPYSNSGVSTYNTAPVPSYNTAPTPSYNNAAAPSYSNAAAPPSYNNTAAPPSYNNVVAPSYNNAAVAAAVVAPPTTYNNTGTAAPVAFNNTGTSDYNNASVVPYESGATANTDFVPPQRPQMVLLPASAAVTTPLDTSATDDINTVDPLSVINENDVVVPDDDGSVDPLFMTNENEVIVPDDDGATGVSAGGSGEGPKLGREQRGNLISVMMFHKYLAQNVPKGDDPIPPGWEDVRKAMELRGFYRRAKYWVKCWSDMSGRATAKHYFIKKMKEEKRDDFPLEMTNEEARVLVVLELRDLQGNVTVKVSSSQPKVVTAPAAKQVEDVDEDPDDPDEPEIIPVVPSDEPVAAESLAVGGSASTPQGAPLAASDTAVLTTVVQVDDSPGSKALGTVTQASAADENAAKTTTTRRSSSDSIVIVPPEEPAAEKATSDSEGRTKRNGRGPSQTRSKSPEIEVILPQRASAPVVDLTDGDMPTAQKKSPGRAGRTNAGSSQAAETTAGKLTSDKDPPAEESTARSGQAADQESQPAASKAKKAQEGPKDSGTEESSAQDATRGRSTTRKEGAGSKRKRRDRSDSSGHSYSGGSSSRSSSATRKLRSGNSTPWERTGRDLRPGVRASLNYSHLLEDDSDNDNDNSPADMGDDNNNNDDDSDSEANFGSDAESQDSNTSDSPREDLEALCLPVQREYLLDCMQRQRQDTSPTRDSMDEAFWKNLATDLNSRGTSHPHQLWKKMWTQMKNNFMAKIQAINRGDGSLDSLTDDDRKMMRVLGIAGMDNPAVDSSGAGNSGSASRDTQASARDVSRERKTTADSTTSSAAGRASQSVPADVSADTPSADETNGNNSSSTMDVRMDAAVTMVLDRGVPAKRAAREHNVPHAKLNVKLQELKRKREETNNEEPPVLTEEGSRPQRSEEESASREEEHSQAKRTRLGSSTNSSTGNSRASSTRSSSDRREERGQAVQDDQRGAGAAAGATPGAPRGRITREQKAAMLAFLASRRALARGELAPAVSERKWQDLHDILEQLGPSRTAKQWRRMWDDLKTRAHMKSFLANKARTENRAAPMPVTEEDKRIMEIIGETGERSPAAAAAASAAAAAAAAALISKQPAASSGSSAPSLKAPSKGASSTTAPAKTASSSSAPSKAAPSKPTPSKPTSSKPTSSNTAPLKVTRSTTAPPKAALLTTAASKVPPSTTAPPKATSSTSAPSKASSTSSKTTVSSKPSSSTTSSSSSSSSSTSSAPERQPSPPPVKVPPRPPTVGDVKPFSPHAPQLVVRLARMTPVTIEDSEDSDYGATSSRRSSMSADTTTPKKSQEKETPEPPQPEKSAPSPVNKSGITIEQKKHILGLLWRGDVPKVVKGKCVKGTPTTAEFWSRLTPELNKLGPPRSTAQWRMSWPGLKNRWQGRLKEVKKRGGTIDDLFLEKSDASTSQDGDNVASSTDEAPGTSGEKRLSRSNESAECAPPVLERHDKGAVAGPPRRGSCSTPVTRDEKVKETHDAAASQPSAANNLVSLMPATPPVWGQGQAHSDIVRELLVQHSTMLTAMQSQNQQAFAVVAQQQTNIEMMLRQNQEVLANQAALLQQMAATLHMQSEALTRPHP